MKPWPAPTSSSWIPSSNRAGGRRPHPRLSRRRSVLDRREEIVGCRGEEIAPKDERHGGYAFQIQRDCFMGFGGRHESLCAGERKGIGKRIAALGRRAGQDELTTVPLPSACAA